MALIDFFSDIKLLKRRITEDKLGAYTEELAPVLIFKGAVTTTSSGYEKRAEAPATDTLYTLTTTKEVPISFNDIIETKEPRARYELISDSMQTPKSAGLNIRQFKARKI